MKDWIIRQKNKLIEDKIVFASLLVVLAMLVLFTLLVTLQKVYLVEYSGLSIKVHPQFSLSGLAAKLWSVLYLIITVIVSLVCGFIIATIFFSKQKREQMPLYQDRAITESLGRALADNLVEGTILLLISIFVFFNLAAWIEDLNQSSPTSLAPTLIALFLTLLSTSITVVAMHYAFLAERKSSETLKNSRDLLAERGEFLEHFSGFIRRINRRIIDHGGLLEDVSENQKNEEHIYFIKCMFLTPFLGHAGLTPSNKEILDDYQKFQNNITQLINNPYCKVQILTLTAPQLVKWYAEIQWVEQAKIAVNEKRKRLLRFSEREEKEIREKVKRILLEEKGIGTMRMDANYGTVPSFNDLRKQYETSFRGNKNDDSELKKLEICHVDEIPFQLFLIMKPKIEDHDEFPKTESFGRDPKTKELIEDGKFVVLSFVGSKTYYRLIEDMLEGTERAAENGGIDNLLENLHSAFYSEDPRMCKILNKHFNHYWANTAHKLHYPQVEEDDWRQFDFKEFLPPNTKQKQHSSRQAQSTILLTLENGLLSTYKRIESVVMSKLDAILTRLSLSNSHGPLFIKNFIDSGLVSTLTSDKQSIASHRWQVSIDGAENAQRAIPILRTINSKKTALLVVDMQRAFLDEGAAIEVAEGRLIVPNINRIASVLREKGGQVIFLRFLVNDQVGMLKYFEGKSYLGSDRESPMEALQAGHPQFELHPDLDVKENDIVMDKTRFSAVIGSNIVDVLREHAIENVIVTGVTTDVCAGNTAEDLMQKDFHIVMVWDGTATLDRLEHELYLARIFGLYGDVMPTEEVLGRLK
ncbi:MAG: cysteine hydrolase [Acidobacteriota bacterium]